MIGFFHKWSIIGTVIQGVFTEFSALIRKLGSLWHVFLILWTVLYAITHRDSMTIENIQYDVRAINNVTGLICGIIFLISSLHLWVIRSLKLSVCTGWFRYVILALSKLFNVALQLTMPIFFLNYAWFPFQNAMSCLLKLGADRNHVSRNIQCPIVSVAMAVLFLYFVVIQKEKDGQSINNSNNLPGKLPSSFEKRVTRQSAMRTRLRSGTLLTPEQHRKSSQNRA